MTDGGATKEAFCELDIVEKYKREASRRTSRTSELRRKVRDVAARNAEIERLYAGNGDEPKKVYDGQPKEEEVRKLYENARLTARSGSSRRSEGAKLGSAGLDERHKSRSLSRKATDEARPKDKRSTTVEPNDGGTNNATTNKEVKNALKTISSATVCENCSGHIGGDNKTKTRRRRRDHKREPSSAKGKELITVFENKNVVEQTDSMKECSKDDDKNNKETPEVLELVKTASPPKIVEESEAKRRLARMRRRLAKAAKDVEARVATVDRKELGFSQLNLVPDVGQYVGLRPAKCVTTQTSKDQVAVAPEDDDVFGEEIVRPKDLSQTTLALRDIFKVCELEKVNSFRNKSSAVPFGAIPERELRNFQRLTKGGNIVRNAKFHTSKTVMPNERVVEIASRTFRNQKVSFTVEGVEPAKRLHMHFNESRLPPQCRYSLEKQVFPGIDINCGQPESVPEQRELPAVSTFKASLRRRWPSRYRVGRRRKVRKQRKALVETSTQTLVQEVPVYPCHRLEVEQLQPTDKFVRRRFCVDSDTQTDNRADIAVEANLETTNSSTSEEKSREQNRRFFDYVMSVFHTNVEYGGSRKKVRRRKCESSLSEQKSKSCGHLERLLQNLRGKRSVVSCENSAMGESLRSDGTNGDGKSTDCLRREVVVLEKCLDAILSKLYDKSEDGNARKKRRSTKHCTYKPRKPSSRPICTISTATGARISLYRQNTIHSKSRSRLKSVYRNDRALVSTSTSEATVSNKSAPSVRRLAFCNVLRNSYVPARSSSRSSTSSKPMLAGVKRRAMSRRYARDLRRLVRNSGGVVVLSVSSTCTFYTSSSNRLGRLQRRQVEEDSVVAFKDEGFGSLKAAKPFYISEPGGVKEGSKASEDSLETKTAACPLSVVFHRQAASCAYRVYNAEVAECVENETDSSKVKTLTTFAEVYTDSATSKDEPPEPKPPQPSPPEPMRTESCQSLYLRYVARRSAEKHESPSPTPQEHPDPSSTCVLTDSCSTVPNESGYDTSKSVGIRNFFSRNSSLLDVFKPKVKVNRDKWFKFARRTKGEHKGNARQANLTTTTFQSDSYTTVRKDEEVVTDDKYIELEKKLDFLLSLRLSGKGGDEVGG